MADQKLEFDGVNCVGKFGAGKLVFSSEQFGWTTTEPGKPKQELTYRSGELDGAEILEACGAGKCLLKLTLKADNGIVRFAGLRADKREALQQHLATHYSVELRTGDVCTSGHSWGEWALAGKHEMELKMEGKSGFQLPLASLTDVKTIGKSDMCMRFTSDQGARPSGADVLDEIRFSLPATGSPGEMSAEQLRDELLRLTASSAESSESLARIDKVRFQVPKGEHELEFFADKLKMHGKTQSHTLMWRAVDKAYLVDYALAGSMKEYCLLLKLGQRLQVGVRQSVEFLPIQLSATRELEESVLREDKRKELAKDFSEGRIPEWKLVTQLVKGFTGKGLFGPAAEFMTKDKQHYLRCSVGSLGEGYFFPFKFAILVLAKPVIFRKYDEMEDIVLEKPMRDRGTFNLRMRLKDLESNIELQGFADHALDSLCKFLTGKVKVVNEVVVKKEPQTPGGSSSSAPAGVAGRQVAGRTMRQRAVVRQPLGADALLADDDSDYVDEDGGGSESSDASDDSDVKPAAKKKQRR
mmetsp:Transcript_63266/g.150898  ORF Transcript_63266/g.150898 Transcript_63266/m.150898 type:complete len:526 (+) Transcript_63266:134-1711(+)